MTISDWINEVSKHEQLLFLFFRELCNFFRALGRMFVCFYFSANFSRLYWPRARSVSIFLLMVCTTGIKISRIFFESDEYLFIFLFDITGVQKMISQNRRNNSRDVLSCLICLKWRQSISKDFKYTNDNYFAFSPPPRTSKETLLPRNSSKF